MNRAPGSLVLIAVGGLVAILLAAPACGLPLGSRLRVTGSGDARKSEGGTYAGSSGATLLLPEPEGGTLHAWPLSTVTTAEVSRGVHGRSLIGAGVGLLVGAATGAMLGNTLQSEFGGGGHLAAAGAVYFGV